MKNDNPKGILYILVGMAIFSIQDALIKFIYEDTALYELYFGRTLIAIILLTGYLFFTKQKNKSKLSIRESDKETEVASFLHAELKESLYNRITNQIILFRK